MHSSSQSVPCKVVWVYTGLWTLIFLISLFCFDPLSNTQRTAIPSKIVCPNFENILQLIDPNIDQLLRSYVFCNTLLLSCHWIPSSTCNRPRRLSTKCECSRSIWPILGLRGNVFYRNDYSGHSSGSRRNCWVNFDGPIFRCQKTPVGNASDNSSLNATGGRSHQNAFDTQILQEPGPIQTDTIIRNRQGASNEASSETSRSGERIQTRKVEQHPCCTQN